MVKEVLTVMLRASRSPGIKYVCPSIRERSNGILIPWPKLPPCDRRRISFRVLARIRRRSAKLESLHEEIVASLARRKSDGFVRRAIKAYSRKRGDVAALGQSSRCGQRKRTKANPPAFHTFSAWRWRRWAIMHKALVTYERALSTPIPTIRSC